MKLVEQLCQGDRSKRRGWRRIAKREAAKAQRRAAKKDPEDAPRKLRYRGYSL